MANVYNQAGNTAKLDGLYDIAELLVLELSSYNLSSTLKLIRVLQLEEF